MIHNKNYISPDAIITHLMDKGLLVDDDDGLLVKCAEEAEAILRSIGYYRFKIYLRPFLNPETNLFYDEASFDKAYQMYRFDDDLRGMLFSLIGRIEVKIRTRLDQTVTEHTGDSFWYLNSQLFSPSAADHRPDLNKKFRDSKDDFVKHYKANYKAPEHISVFHQNMPPFWVMAELTTFGNIVSLFGSLNKSHFVEDRYNNKLDLLSKEFGAASLDIFNSWLESLRETRNRCAHHSRVWNRNCSEAKGIQGKKSRFNLNLLSESKESESNFSAGRKNKLYSALFVIFQVSKSLNINRNIKEEFLTLLEMYPESKAHLHSAGFPEDWQALSAWNR